MLAWYDRHARDLPWRVGPLESKQGVVSDPYHVWLSEVMLQQTTVTAVKPYFDKFIRKWPTVTDLASSDVEDVMKAWAGLGYYSRARNLKACADHVTDAMGARFPQNPQELQKLPGIGEYTSAAIAAIAFGVPAAVVDGNIERVSTRHLANATPLPKVKTNCRAFMERVTPHDRPGDFVQAMMDLGATICTPKTPSCSICPINQDCKAFQTGTMLDFPVRAPRKSKPVRQGAAFVAQRSDGAIWLVKRPQTGLLAGMSTVPTTDWTASRDGDTGAEAAPFRTEWQSRGTIRHTFTHFHLVLHVWSGRSDSVSGDGWWSAGDKINSEALPSLMKKVIAAAIDPSPRKPYHDKN